MRYQELFTNARQIPEPLAKEELYLYLGKAKQGDLKAREKVITHNVKLVLNEVVKKFWSTPYDKTELVEVGMIGLIKGVDSFDMERTTEFTTYVGKCINNEICMFLRKAKKYVNHKSIYNPVAISENGDEQKIEDVLEDETKDFVYEIEKQITYSAIRRVISDLPDKDKELIILYFGFIDGKRYTQMELAEKFGISQSYVAKAISKIVKKIGVQLKNEGYIDKVKGISEDQANQVEDIKSSDGMVKKDMGRSLTFKRKTPFNK